MSNERFPTPGGVPSLVSSLVSSDGRNTRRRHVSILGDLAGTPPAECRSSAWRGPALFAATFVLVIAGTLWAGHRNSLGSPHSALAPRADAPTGATQSPAPVGDAGSAAETSPTPLAVPSAAVIVNVAPAGPASAQAAPADAVSTERSAAAVATSRTPAKASPTPRAASRSATQPRRQSAPAAPADEPDIDIITAIVRHASPER
jgi:hypothetical protein